MTKSKMVGVVVLVIFVVVGGLSATTAVGAHNTEVGLRNAIAAKQRDNQSEYDNLWKKIAQAVEVTQQQKQALIEIFVAHAESRGGGADDEDVISWLKESVPNVDTTTFNNLQNIIVAGRNGFTMRQKELLDLKREHDTLLDAFPSGMILGWLGRERIEVTVITSSKAAETFAEGSDDDVSLPFEK